MESLVLSPISAKHYLTPNLISVSAFPKNVTFNQSVCNYLVSTSEVICLIDPCLPPKEGDLE